jgi:hypothetical protein
MINKISANNLYNPNSNYNLRSGKTYFAQNFCGIKLYNDRTFNEEISLNIKKSVLPILKKAKNFFTSFFEKPQISKEEYLNNNKFIEKVRNIIPDKYPLGEFEGVENNLFTIKQTNDNKLSIRWYKIDENTNKKNLFRSVIINKNNEIEFYETSYPWKIFEKTAKGYICKKNSDAYIRKMLKEPENQIMMTPTLL